MDIEAFLEKYGKDKVMRNAFMWGFVRGTLRFILDSDTIDIHEVKRRAKHLLDLIKKCEELD